jgi:hypothetical protein
MNISKVIGLFIVAISVAVYSTPILGDNITQYDGQSNNEAWHGADEDQEVEPPDAKGQIWDLEGFFLNGKNLSMVGGYDFKNGQQDPWRSGDEHLYLSGDIFIGKNGSVVYGSEAGTAEEGYDNISNSVFGYDYAVDIDVPNLTYTVYDIDENTELTNTYFKDNRPANPFQLASPGSETIVGQGDLIYYSDKSDDEIAAMGNDANFLSDPEGVYYYSRYRSLGLNSQTHNAVSGISLDFLPEGYGEFVAKFTMGCGNDNLVAVASVPEPQMLSLIIIGIAGISISGIFRRKKG